MTGRDLIVYILQNGLEDEPVCGENGRLLGFMTTVEAAVKFGVGVETIRLWIAMGIIPGVKIGEENYIPMDAKPPFGPVTDEDVERFLKEIK